MAVKWPIEVEMSENGELTLPAPLRKLLGLQPGALIEVMPMGTDEFSAHIASPLRRVRLAGETWLTSQSPTSRQKNGRRTR